MGRTARKGPHFSPSTCPLSKYSRISENGLGRIVLKTKEVLLDLFEAGFIHEPELIDFYGEKCIYGDAVGNLFLAEL